MREELLDRMIRIYGFEHPLVIQFAKMCENYTTCHVEAWNRCLKAFVEAHEKEPQIF